MDPNVDNSLNAGVPVASGLPNLGMAPAQAQAAAVYPTSLRTTSNVPQQASDVDVIEDAWIGAVRQAAAANSGDPHAMSDAVASLRREYLQRRYGKSIETNK